MRVRDDYAGAGGWSEGLKLLDIEDVGIEFDQDACQTRMLNGHSTIRADLGQYPMTLDLDIYIASPPCQTFSYAGKGHGRASVANVVDHIRNSDWSKSGDLDDRTSHVLRVAERVMTHLPGLVALEQVPPVLPIWEAIAERMRIKGYSVWTGVLNSADYGVPQTRRRAILLASASRQVAEPRKTHSEERWITMADALGWKNPKGYDTWPWRLPSTTVAGDPRVSARCHHYHGSQGRGAVSTTDVVNGRYDGKSSIRLTEDEMLKLQGFRDGFVLAGKTATSRRLQIGNAIPPKLAKAIIAEGLGL